MIQDMLNGIFTEILNGIFGTEIDGCGITEHDILDDLTHRWCMQKSIEDDNALIETLKDGTFKTWAKDHICEYTGWDEWDVLQYLYKERS